MTEPRPDDINEVLAEARRLAKAVAESDRAIALNAAVIAVQNDPEARELFARFQAAGREMRAAGDGADDSGARERLAECHQAVRANPVLQDLLRAQADYMELAVRLEEVIYSQAPRVRRAGGALSIHSPFENEV